MCNCNFLAFWKNSVSSMGGDTVALLQSQPNLPSHTYFPILTLTLNITLLQFLAKSILFRTESQNIYHDQISFFNFLLFLKLLIMSFFTSVFYVSVICKAGKYFETPNISKWVLPSHLNESLTGHKILG